MRRLCVFCGSSPGIGNGYLEAAESLGRVLVDRGVALVYGGASVGLMGRLAETVLEGGGEVIGVMPAGLAEREVAFEGLSDLRVVATMHERKAVMADLADAFIALPGGMGTLEEFFEALTWTQLGLHDKGCGLLNVAGYFDPLMEFLDRAAEQRFIRPEHREMVLVDGEPARLVDRLVGFRPPVVDKAEWIRSLSPSRREDTADETAP
jgi:uncharacterized protein (TIGR00730 family)